MSLQVSALPPSSNYCSASPQPLTVKEIENIIASTNATQIQGIATSLIAHVMQHLRIDIEVSNIPKHFRYPLTSMPEQWPCYDSYSPNSKLMKILLPTCIERITAFFSTPSEFVQIGILFDLLNQDKTGLLDQVEDETLKQKIAEGMKASSTYSIALKTRFEKTLRLEMEQWIDGEALSSTTASIESFTEYATTHII